MLTYYMSTELTEQKTLIPAQRNLNLDELGQRVRTYSGKLHLQVKRGH